MATVWTHVTGLLSQVSPWIRILPEDPVELSFVLHWQLDFPGGFHYYARSNFLQLGFLVSLQWDNREKVCHESHKHSLYRKGYPFPKIHIMQSKYYKDFGFMNVAQFSDNLLPLVKK